MESRCEVTRTSCVKLVHTPTRGHCTLIMSLEYFFFFLSTFGVGLIVECKVFQKHIIYSKMASLCQACAHTNTETLLNKKCFEAGINTFYTAKNT